MLIIAFRMLNYQNSAGLEPALTFRLEHCSLLRFGLNSVALLLFFFQRILLVIGVVPRVRLRERNDSLGNVGRSIRLGKLGAGCFHRV